MKLSEIRVLLDREGIRLTRSLGQSFLHDANQLRRIVAAADLTATDRVLEIGPGLGPLTERLVREAGTVLAIEMDRRLAGVLQERLAGAPNLRLVHGDALAWLREHPADWSGWKLVSNLPYSVASPILVELARMPQGPQRLVVTLQLEVAQRLLAGASDPDYGVLTLLVQLTYEPQAQFKIPASCFFPEPAVDSACVVLQRRPEPLLDEAQRERFVRLVKRSFSQRRKMLFKLLRADWPEERLAGAFAATRLDARVRAESLRLDQFVKLTRLLQDPGKGRAGARPGCADELG